MNTIMKRPTLQADNFEQQERLLRQTPANENSQKKKFYYHRHVEPKP